MIEQPLKNALIDQFGVVSDNCLSAKLSSGAFREIARLDLLFPGATLESLSDVAHDTHRRAFHLVGKSEILAKRL